MILFIDRVYNYLQLLSLNKEPGTTASQNPMKGESFTSNESSMAGSASPPSLISNENPFRQNLRAMLANTYIVIH